MAGDRFNRPTLRSIAEAVGVTANTVSLALKDSPLVAPETKARIFGAARAQGYVQNAIAGSLRSGRSFTIAIIVGDVSNLVFALKIKALEKRLRELKYQVMILSTDEEPEIEYDAVKAAISRNVDGVIICPCQQSTGALELMRQYGVPCVLMGRHFGLGTYDAVAWDDLTGGLLATRHMLERGCRRIMLLGAPSCISSARERREGFIMAHSELGVAPDPALMFEVSPKSGGASELLNSLDGWPECDGIFAFSDLMAWEAACFLREKAIRNVRLAGFDDVLSHVRLPFELTSVGASIDDETASVIELLLRRIEDFNATVELRRIGVYLVDRDQKN